jgi:hypothetical protein
MEKTILDKTALQDGDRIRLGLDSKAPELLFRASVTLLEEALEEGESVLYARIEFRFEDEEKSKEVKLEGVARSSLARTGARLLIGSGNTSHLVLSRPGILEKHAQFAVLCNEKAEIGLKLENLAREDFEIEEGNSPRHLLPKRNHLDLKYQCGRLKLSPQLPWLEYNIIPGKELESVLTELVTSIVTERKKLSELIPQPDPEKTYHLGSAESNDIHIPHVDAELVVFEVLPGDEKFTIRRKPETKTRVLIEGQEILPGERRKFHFGENLVLGSFDISNDFRVLFVRQESKWLRRLLITLSFIFIALVLASLAYLAKEKGWFEFARVISPSSNASSTSSPPALSSSQHLVFLASLDRELQIQAQGTAVVIPWKDHFLAISHKSLVEPWKYQAHQKISENQVEIQGKDPQDLPFFYALWFSKDRAMKDGTFLIENAVNNFPLNSPSSRQFQLLSSSNATPEEFESLVAPLEGFRKLKKGGLNEFAFLKIEQVDRPLLQWKWASGSANLPCFALFYKLNRTENLELERLEGVLHPSPEANFWIFRTETSAFPEGLTGAFVFDKEDQCLGILQAPTEGQADLFVCKASFLQKLIEGVIVE